MAEITHSVDNLDEFDIRIYLRAIFRRWKLLLILTILGAVVGGALFLLNRTSYKATSTVFVNSLSTPYLITPQFLVQSEAVKKIVLQETGLEETELPDITISVEKTDKNIVTITARSENPQLALKVANAWADATLRYSQEAESLLATDVEKARIRLEQLDGELSTFLLNSGLQDLSWVEMIAITGGSDTSNIAILESSRQLPVIPLSKRNEIKKFVRKINIAQWEYYDISKQLIMKEYVTNQSAFVLNHATRAENETSLLNKLTIPLGAFLGFFFAIIIILISNWWKSK